MEDIKSIEERLNVEIPEEIRKDLKKAIEFYKKFHWGKEIDKIQKIDIEIPKIMTALGHVIGIIYLSEKPDKELFIHAFKPPFPILAFFESKEVLGNKNYLMILGGNFKIRKEGIIH